jgi:hypothetical protein
MNYLLDTPENRALGFSSGAEHAPLWAQTYIQECRAAIAEKRKMNASVLTSFTVGCERRSAVAATFERGAFRPFVATRPVAGLITGRVPLNPTGVLTEQQLAEARGRLKDKKLREKLEAQGRRIRADQMRDELGELSV